MKRFFILLMVVLMSLPKLTFAQSPFVLRGEISFPIGIAALSMFGAERQLNAKRKMRSVMFIDSLKPAQVNRFDRGAITQNNKICRYVSDGMLVTSALLPLPLLADPKIRKDFGKVMLMDVEVFLLNSALTNLVKTAVGRPRPLVYNPEIPIYQKRAKDNFNSFFSGHTSMASSQSFFMATVFTMYNPKNKFLPLVWTAAVSFPLTMGVMRFKAGKHFWTDVLTGYAVGAIVGAGVPLLHSATIWNKK